MKNLYKEYRNVQKNAGKQSNITLESNFKKKLDKLFDIAHANSLEIATEEVKEFLIDQRHEREKHLKYIFETEFTSCQKSGK